MGKKKRKSPKRTRKAADAKLISPSNGFDFGCLPLAMALGAFEFIGHLGKADIVAVAYGGGWVEEVEANVPIISLVARHPEHLRKAFEDFHAWANATDADAVELTIVLRSKGGFLLGLTPEAARLKHRCLGFDRTHRVLMAAPTWVKPIDSVQPFLLEIKDYLKGPISPFYLEGAWYDGEELPASRFIPPAVRQIAGLKPLLKFEATIVDEADVEPGTTAALVLAMDKRRKDSKPARGRPKPSAQDLDDERVRSLRTHFPVTLERLREHPNIRDTMQSLASEGIETWQIEQAICNISLSLSIGRGCHYDGLPKGDLPQVVTHELNQRYELADHISLSTWSMDQLRVQILADANALLRCLGKSRVQDLSAVQRALDAAFVRKATCAVLDSL
jgi:hypothetical protein